MTREVSERATVPEQREGSHDDAHVVSPAEETDRLRTDISRTRTELGETIEALAAKADLKARTRQEARRAMDRARSASGSAPRRRQLAVAAVGVVVAGAAVVVVLRSRRARAAVSPDAPSSSSWNPGSGVADLWRGGG